MIRKRAPKGGAPGLGAPVLLPLLLCLHAAIAPAEVVVVRSSAPAAPGHSLYASAPIPALGAGDRTRAARMLRTETGWELAADFPPGIHPVALIERPDAPAELRDDPAANVVETKMVEVAGAAPAPAAIAPLAADASPPRTETFTFAPRNFAPRTVRVLLPRGFDSTRTGDYPSLWAMDGQNVFAPGSAFGCWNLDATVTRLVDSRAIPPIVVVAIDNTGDRFAEYIPEELDLGGSGLGGLRRGRAAEFLAAIETELMPAVERRYRLSPEAGKRAIIGSSLGGLIALQAACRRPQTWGIAAACSPSSQIDLPQLKRMAAESRGTRARLWIDSGTGSGGRSTDGYERTMELRDALLREGGAALGPAFIHTAVPGHDHNERAWAERSPAIVEWMFGGG